MAQALSNDWKTEIRKAGGTPDVDIYDWHNWLSGNVWKLERGVDFSCDESAFIAEIDMQATSRGIEARKQSIRQGESSFVYVQAVR